MALYTCGLWARQPRKQEYVARARGPNRMAPPRGTVAKCGGAETRLTLRWNGQLPGLTAESALAHTLLPQSCHRAAPSLADFSCGMAAESSGGAKSNEQTLADMVA